MSNFREFMRNQFYTNNDMYSFKTDDEIFEAMADFITSLDPDQLNDDQIDNVLNILDEIEVDPYMHDPEDDDLDEKRLAKKTKVKDKLQAKKYYKKNKQKIKKRKKKFKKSAEGRQRKKKSERMAKAGRTATGRKKVSYRK